MSSSGEPQVTREYGEQITKEFYAEVFCPSALKAGWISKPAADAKQVQKDPVSHNCINGACYTFQNHEPVMIHPGKFFVPIDTHEDKPPESAETDDDREIYTNPNGRFLKHMARAIAKGARIYLHEMASPIHPVYFDVDFKTDYSATDVEYMLRIIKGERKRTLINLDEMMAPVFQARDETFWNDFEDSYLTKIAYKITKTPYECLPEKRKSAHDESLTWIGLFEDMVGIRGSRLDVLQESRDVLQYMFVIAVASEIQMVVSGFYPNVPLVDLRTMVLTSLARDERGERFGKIGAHIYMTRLLVDMDLDVRIRETVVRHFIINFGTTPDSDGDWKTIRAFWSDVVDVQVYGQGGGLRMPYCYKPQHCESCKSHRNKLCSMCHGSGKVSLDRRYVPCAELSVNPSRQSCLMNISMNNFDKVKTFRNARQVSPKSPLKLPLQYFLSLRLMFDPDYETRVLNTLNRCTLRRTKTSKITDGVFLEDKPLPIDLGKLHNKIIENVTGSKAMISAVTTDVKRMIGNREADAPEITALFEHRIHLLTNKINPAPQVRSVQLAPSDTRYVMVESVLPIYLRDLFDRRYESISVRTITMVYTDSQKQIPEKLIVYVRGLGARLCFNRTVKKNRRGMDNSSIAGEHTTHHNCVYFVISRERTGSITQKCCNQAMKDSFYRRNAANGMACCHKWPGKKVYLGSSDPTIKRKIEENIRDMFYTEEQQASDTMYIDEQNYQRFRMMQVYKNGKRKFDNVEAVGPRKEPHDSNKKIHI